MGWVLWFQIVLLIVLVAICVATVIEAYKS